MDRKLVEQHRLALFGRMVMGVAHEVDNYLSVILGFAELIQIAGAAEKKTLDGVAKIYNAGEKINVIVKHFSHYVRPHDPGRELFSPSEAVAECMVFARYDLGRGGVNLKLPESMPEGMLTVDRRDFALALLALLFNGAEAMEPNGGTLRLDISKTDGHWEFVVADEGSGIPAELESRVFEEGFTTKKGSLHTGMGLPLARHLASEMGGTVTLANLPGRGCRAVLRFPAN